MSKFKNIFFLIPERSVDANLFNKSSTLSHADLRYGSLAISLSVDPIPTAYRYKIKEVAKYKLHRGFFGNSRNT